MLNGANMTVTSPDTPTGKPTGAPGTSTSNDALNDAGQHGQRLPARGAGDDGARPDQRCDLRRDVPDRITEHRVASTKCNGQTYNPLVNAGETGTGGVTVGDAIVQGTVNSPMTIGSANNIVIDGNICYADAVSAGTCTAAPAAPSTNVLGLVADNYVEINHPVDSNGNNVSTCSQTLGAGTPTCDLSNPNIDAVALALNHSVPGQQLRHREPARAPST